MQETLSTERESGWLLRELTYPGKNIRMFKSQLAERLTYVHPIVPAAIWLPVSLICLWISGGKVGLGQTLLLLLGGMASWTLAEYCIHRYLFHFKTTAHWQERVLFYIHGVHHDDPNDARRLLMPPTASLVLAVVFFSLFRWLWGPERVFAFFAGFVIGYLIYDYIHFATHFVRAKWEWLRILKQHHLQHHFMNPHKQFGVSSALWDVVFRTR